MRDVGNMSRLGREKRKYLSADESVLALAVVLGIEPFE